MMLWGLLNRLIRVGTLTVIDADGKARVFSGDEGPEVTVRFVDRSLPLLLALNPSLHTGEAYMNGALTVENGSVYDLLDLICRNAEIIGWPLHSRAAGLVNRAIRYLRQFNPPKRAHRNAAHHYDATEGLYDLFLDGDRQYSCAYFAREDDDLETAQENKKRLIAAKLLIEPGNKVLDIGSGWGGLALYLAGKHGARVTGLTLSAEQLDASRKSAREAGLSDRVRFHLRDYREQTGLFDRIVSVGMFEHVGIGHHKTFFAKVRDLLCPDGVALIHTIGRAEAPGETDPWIRKYIFPGGYIPALSEVAASVEKAGLWTTDVEVLRLHYAETIRHWRRRFQANRDKAAALQDERFCRMWEYYLASAEVGFRYLRNTVFQIQLSKRQDAVPLTRDYLAQLSLDDRKGAGRESRHAA